MEKRQRAREVTGDAGERGREGTVFAAALVGRAVAALGVLAGLVGAISVLWPTAVANVVPSASVGIILGMVGYFLRARRLAVAAVVLSAVALVLAVVVGQGLLPWTGPTDPIKN
ncbi:MAG: hypothetical protein CYG60_12595 [Actinobacteria bacterium]|nr:hypothetical protein [Actinomycetota bacterium]PLS85436.1 MAG: hypothetical protein CYG60_12595 [Actinomycetota bacterium]